MKCILTFGSFVKKAVSHSGRETGLEPDLPEFKNWPPSLTALGTLSKIWTLSEFHGFLHKKKDDKIS